MLGEGAKAAGGIGAEGWPLQDIVSLRGFIYCTIIFFANTPFIVQYIAQYYQLLHPPAKI